LVIKGSTNGDTRLNEPSTLVSADALRRAGRFDEAIALYRQAIGRSPRDPAAWSAMADCLFAARRTEDAIGAWDMALRLAPDAPVALCGKARVLQSLSRVAEAETLYHRALASGGDVPPARFGLAMLALEAGRLDEAEAMAGPLRSDPLHPDVLSLTARIALARGELDGAAEMLGRLLTDPRLDGARRAETLITLGQTLDGLDRPSEAFAAAVEGKAIQRRLFAQRAAGREGETAKLSRLAAWFAAAKPGDWAPAPRLAARIDGEAAAHVFLVGFPRSGTTLLEQILAGHPDVRALEEAPTLATHYAEFLGSDQGCARLAGLTGPEADAWRARYWTEVKVQGIETEGRLFLDKAPAGTLYLPLIAKLFPGAKVLFAVRDPRDVTLSCLRNAFQMNAMTYAFTALEETAACYCACMAMAEVYRAVLPIDLIEVRHETLVEDFDAELARITGFLGLAPHPAMNDIAATAHRRSVRTPSAHQVRAGLSRRGLARWRAYATELAPVRDVLEPWVERFGYPER